MSDLPAETTEKLKRAPGLVIFLIIRTDGHGTAVSLLLTSCQSCQNHAASLIRDIKARILVAPGTGFTELARRLPNPGVSLFVHGKNCRVF